MKKNLAINGLDRQISAQIVKLILDYKKPEKIVIFGSRASNEYQAASDIDIAIFGRDWPDTDINIIKHTLDEYVKTPLKFSKDKGI